MGPPLAADTRSVFLGVEQSVSGKRWEERLEDSRLGLALAQRLGGPEIVGRVLAGRGVGLEAVESFLNPTLRDALPDPSHLKDMDRGGGAAGRGPPGRRGRGGLRRL